MFIKIWATKLPQQTHKYKIIKHMEPQMQINCLKFNIFKQYKI